MFVSSTLDELASERTATRGAIEALRFIPVLFELGARPHPPRALYRAYLEQSHVFVGIYWQRYGWVAPGMNISGLEDEYDLAAGMPKLVYVKDSPDGREPSLNAMLDRIASGGVSYRRFETAEELARLLADDLALLVSERFARAAEAVPGRRVSIPSPLSSFVGRDRELRSVVELVSRADVRLVTLTGPGGIGKTRLAFEAARRAADCFADGVATVLLAPLRDPEGVVPAVAEALGVSESREASLPEALRAHLAGRELLLVLDNMEQVLAAVPAVGDLLEGAPGVTALVTSRARLGVTGEYSFVVPPLSLPAAGELELRALEQSDAIRLFAARAEAAGWKTAAPDAPIVAEIVRRLDGLPLAIELAAAQARLVPAELIHARLRRRLDLAGGPRDAEERHRTLRNAIAWSYDLLDEPARYFFETLAVFAGGFSIEAAAAVAEAGDDVEKLLASLVDASLVTIEPAPVTGVRFGMLETIHEYASERLDERRGREAAAGRHLAYFTKLADEVYDAPAERRLLARLRLDEERDNFRAAFEEAMRSSPAEGVRLAGDLEHLWSFRGLAHEGRDAIARALSAAPDAPAAWRARALVSGAWLAAEQGDFDEAEREALEALPLFRTLGDARHVGETLKALAWSAYGRGDTDGAIRRLEESYRALSDVPDESLRVDAAISLAGSLSTRGDLEGARPLYAEALEHYRLHGLDDERASVLAALGAIDERRGDPASARGAYEASVEVSRRIENPRQLSWALICLGRVDAGDGRIEDAARLFAEALALLLDLGDRRGVAFCLEHVARVALARGKAESAARLLGTAAALRDATGALPSQSDASEIEEIEAEASALLGAEAFADAYAGGAAADLSEAQTLADGALSGEEAPDPAGRGASTV